jgi:hypothetical protein
LARAKLSSSLELCAANVLFMLMTILSARCGQAFRILHTGFSTEFLQAYDKSRRIFLKNFSFMMFFSNISFNFNYPEKKLKEP